MHEKKNNLYTPDLVCYGQKMGLVTKEIKTLEVKEAKEEMLSELPKPQKKSS